MRSVCVAAALALAFIPAASASAPGFSGSWNIVGEVQGIPLDLTCALIEAHRKISGTCIGEDEVERKLTGAIIDAGRNRIANWHFDTDYRDTAVTLSLSGSLNADQTGMRGSISLWPQEATGSFTANRRPPSLTRP